MEYTTANGFSKNFKKWFIFHFQNDRPGQPLSSDLGKHSETAVPGSFLIQIRFLGNCLPTHPQANILP